MTRTDSPTTIPRVRRPALRLPRWVSGVIVICFLIEAALLAAPFLGLGIGRSAAFILGGFWSPLLTTGPGLYPGQGALMFLTYGFLHAGLLHLAMNMISLAAVARELNRMIGPGRMALVYLASQIGAGLTFALMEPLAGPMIGASGAVFGLAGALIGHATITLRRRHRSTAPLLRATALILGLNVALTLLMPQIAWQAHLGGGLTGLVMGMVLAMKRHR